MVLVLVFFAGTFGMNFQITSALMATEVFGKGAGEFGLLGSVHGDRLAGRRAARRAARPTIRAPAADRGRRWASASPRSSAGLMPTYLAFAAAAPRSSASPR